MNKLEFYILDHPNIVFFVVAFFPFFTVFNKEFGQALIFIYLVILISIATRKTLLIEKLNTEIEEFSDSHKGEGSCETLTKLSDEIDYAKEIYATFNSLNASVFFGLFWALVITFNY